MATTSQEEQHSASKSRIINKDFIGVLRKMGELLYYSEVDIPQEDALIEEIDNMMDDDSLTLLDVQEKFKSVYPIENHPRYYNYLYPRSYTNATYEGILYPKLLTSDEYKDAVNNWVDMEKNKFFQKEEDTNISVSELQEKDIEMKLQKEVEDLLRRSFNYKSYIYAHNYTLKLQEIQNDNEVVMSSHDKRGWKIVNYVVNDVITISMKTNFGYGRSSYFFCNLKYKDINILPYSAVVDYCYVKWSDFIRYTRQYEADRGNWKHVFKFVVETANLAKTDTDKFIQKWIVNELAIMIDGLRNLVENPNNVLKKYFKEKGEKIFIGFYTKVRNCSDDDIYEYEILPDEKSIAIKAEKIVGCLSLLDNLSKLNEILPIVKDYIEEIKRMNQHILPEIKACMNKIAKDYKVLRQDLDQLLDEIRITDNILNRHKIQIRKLAMHKDSFDERLNDNTDVEAEYKRKHPDYCEQLETKTKLEDKKAEIQTHIRLRKKFWGKLSECVERIKEVLEAA